MSGFGGRRNIVASGGSFDTSAIDASIASLNSSVGTLTSNQNALTTQVGALAPENVIENGEFTATAIKDLLLTVDGALSGIDADKLDGMEGQAILDLIAAKAASVHTHAAGDITGLSSGIGLGGEQYTGWYNQTNKQILPSNAVLTGYDHQGASEWSSAQTRFRYRTITW